MLPMRSTGTPAQSVDVFAEEPYLANWLICSTVTQHHPFDSSGKLVVSGPVGSLYLACQPLGGCLPSLAYLPSCPSSHLRRRSARIRCSSSEAGSVSGCL